MLGSHDSSAQADAVTVPESLDGVRLLAEHVAEPVIILDRQFTILYRNPAAQRADERTGFAEPCYSLCVGRDLPCEGCPAVESFATGASASPPSAEPPQCGLAVAIPISRGDTIVYVAGLLQRPVPEPADACASEDVHSAVPCGGRGDGGPMAELVGDSPPMRQLKEMIALVAGSEAAVLLQGESGTGKELIARTIHRLSPRRDSPFIVVDCGSLPETLLESELFGHVKGAFTGAVAGKKGLFEEAEGGTIFLDEIADTTAHFQSKLLRVLQESEIKPVGGTRPVRVNVRVISATNRSLLDLVKQKAFREDLYYRLAVLPVDLPPLRARREDIPMLVEHFLRVSCQRHGKPWRPIAPEALHALMTAPWPGNVRELKHRLERAVVTARGEQLHRQDFALNDGRPLDSSDLRATARRAAESVERAQIIEALRHCAGKKARAAKVLRISRASLYNKLRVYGIE